MLFHCNPDEPILLVKFEPGNISVPTKFNGFLVTALTVVWKANVSPTWLINVGVVAALL